MTLLRSGTLVRALAVIGLVAAVAPVVTGADTLHSVLGRSGYGSPDQNAIRQLFAEADEAGVPEELLLPRLAEGVAKRVPAARLREALRLHVDGLLVARELLIEAGAHSISAEPASWARAANLLNAGMSSASIRELAAAASETRLESFRPASALLVSLIDWGLAEAAALRLAVAVTRSVLAPDEYAMVIDLLVEGRTRRVDPEEMAERLIQLLPRIRSANDLRRFAL
jgi:hypothetical protein